MEYVYEKIIFLLGSLNWKGYLSIKDSFILNLDPIWWSFPGMTTKQISICSIQHSGAGICVSLSPSPQWLRTKYSEGPFLVLEKSSPALINQQVRRMTVLFLFALVYKLFLPLYSSSQLLSICYIGCCPIYESPNKSLLGR